LEKAWVREGHAVKRDLSVGLSLGILVIAASSVFGETLADGQNKRFERRRAGLQVYERERSACAVRDEQCHARADAK